MIWNGEFWRRRNGSDLVVLTLQTHCFACHLLECVMGGCGPALTGRGCGPEVTGRGVDAERYQVPDVWE